MKRNFTFGLIVLAFTACTHIGREKETTKALIIQKWAFCPDIRGPYAVPYTERKNNEKRTLLDILNLSRASVRIESRSEDLKEAEATQRVQDVLNSRPQMLRALPLWAEGTQFGRKHVIADLEEGDKPAKIEIADYQVCVRDHKGAHWFFRNVPIETWKSE